METDFTMAVKEVSRQHNPGTSAVNSLIGRLPRHCLLLARVRGVPAEPWPEEGKLPGAARSEVFAAMRCLYTKPQLIGTSRSEEEE